MAVCTPLSTPSPPKRRGRICILLSLQSFCLRVCARKKIEPAGSAGQGVCLDTGATKGNSAADLGCQDALATAEQMQAVAAPRILPRAWLSRQLAGLGWQSRRADVCFLLGQALSESKLFRE